MGPKEGKRDELPTAFWILFSHLPRGLIAYSRSIYHPECLQPCDLHSGIKGMAVWLEYLSSTQMLTSTGLLKATALGAAMDYPQSSVTSHSGSLFLVQLLGWPRSMGVRESTLLL